MPHDIPAFNEFDLQSIRLAIGEYCEPRGLEWKMVELNWNVDRLTIPEWVPHEVVLWVMVSTTTGLRSTVLVVKVGDMPCFLVMTGERFLGKSRETQAEILKRITEVSLKPKMVEHPFDTM